MEAGLITGLVVFVLASFVGFEVINIEADLAEDKNRFRVNLIKDCPVVYVVSIGGPAAAKVIQAYIYPMKIEQGGAIREILADLQKAIATSPPPWLAKILGVDTGKRVKNYQAIALRKNIRTFFENCIYTISYSIKFD